jgi:CBS domain containing-hemolysin-like protein
LLTQAAITLFSSERLVISMPTPSLKEFAQAIPVCEQTSSLSALLEIFQASGCDAIVVVSEQQRPLGVVNCGRFYLTYCHQPG